MIPYSAITNGLTLPLEDGAEETLQQLLRPLDHLSDSDAASCGAQSAHLANDYVELGSKIVGE